MQLNSKAQKKATIWMFVDLLWSRKWKVNYRPLNTRKMTLTRAFVLLIAFMWTVIIEPWVSLFVCPSIHVTMRNWIVIKYTSSHAHSGKANCSSIYVYTCWTMLSYKSVSPALQKSDWHKLRVYSKNIIDFISDYYLQTCFGKISILNLSE